MRRFVDVNKVARRYDVSVPTVWRWAREGRIPMPVHLSPGTTRWDDEQLDACDAARDTETDVVLSSAAIRPGPV